MRKRHGRKPKVWPLIDLLFDELMRLLINDCINIFIVKDLRCPKTGQKLDGLLNGDDENEIKIFIDRDIDKNEKTLTLIHELLHYIFPDTPEGRIRLLEKSAWRELSDIQRKALGDYLPKRTSRRKVT
ncbi:MAG: hypothetical protein Q8O87_00505 [bacterium]|nr:hypothetical protein [bacterium]